MAGLATSGQHPAKRKMSGHTKQQGPGWTTPASPRGDRGSARANSMALAGSFPLHTAKHCRDCALYLAKTFPPDR